MSETNNSPYHRLGEPGGVGCDVTTLAIQSKQANGDLVNATLLSAQDAATEVELLRTITHSLGIRWGHDALGWWAVVPAPLEAAAGMADA